MKVQRIKLHEDKGEEIFGDKISYKNLIENHPDLVKLWREKGLPVDSKEKFNTMVDTIAKSLNKNTEDIIWKDLTDYANQEFSPNGMNKPGDLQDKVNALMIKINKASKDEIIDVIKQATSSMKGIPKVIGDNLSDTSEDVLRSFITSARDELLNKNSRLWLAFGNPNAKDVLTSTNTFPLFYNLLIDGAIKPDAEYLNNGKSVIYNKDLYINVRDQDERADLVELDINGEVDKDDLNNAISSGEYRRYISDSSLEKKEINPRYKRSLDDFKSVFSNMGDKEKVQVIADILGSDLEKTATFLQSISR